MMHAIRCPTGAQASLQARQTGVLAVPAHTSTNGARRQRVVAAVRPPGTNKNVLKEGPSGKQVDGEALQDTAQEYVQKIQNWWDDVEEKPAAIAIAVAAIVALWALSGLVDAIDRLPIIGGLLEVVGLIVTGWFVYRYLLFEPDRKELRSTINGFASKVTGKVEKLVN